MDDTEFRCDHCRTTKRHMVVTAHRVLVKLGYGVTHDQATAVVDAIVKTVQEQELSEFSRAG